MDVNIVPVGKAKELIAKTSQISNAFGSFFVTVPTSVDEYNQITEKIKRFSKELSNSKYTVLCGISQEYGTILSYSQAVLALEWIGENRNEMLEGDSVARREVGARKALATL